MMTIDEEVAAAAIGSVSRVPAAIRREDIPNWRGHASIPPLKKCAAAADD
jgi:hypothetical protein